MEGLEALFERALRLDPPWRISKIEFRGKRREHPGVLRWYDSKINNVILEELKQPGSVSQSKAQGYGTSEPQAHHLHAYSKAELL